MSESDSPADPAELVLVAGDTATPRPDSLIAPPTAAGLWQHGYAPPAAGG